MIPTVFTRCVYTYGREFFNQPPSYRVALQADLLCFCYLFTRLPYIYYTVHWSKSRINLSSGDNKVVAIIFDPGLHCLTHLDALLLMIILLLELFHIISKAAMARADIRLPCWRFWKGVFVSLQDAYFSAKLRGDVLKMVQEKRINQLRQRLLPRLFPSFLLPKWICRQAVRLQLWLTFENIDQRRFYALTSAKDSESSKVSLSKVPQLSEHIRRRTVLLLLAYDKIAFAMQAGTALLALSAIVAFRTDLLLHPAYPWYSRAWIAFELITFAYITVRLQHCAFFFTGCSLMTVVVNAGPCKELQRNLRQWISVESHKRKSFGSGSGKGAGSSLKTLSFLAADVRHFLAEHSAHSSVIQVGNRQLYGLGIAAFLLINLPVNATVLAELTFNLAEKSISELLFLLLVLTFQLAAFAVNLLPQAHFCRRMHAPQEEAVALQPYLTISGGNGSDSRYVSLKLKLDDLKCRLSVGKPKVAFTVGALRPVTFETIVEFFTLYFAYLLMNFNHQLKKQLQG